MSKKHSSPSQIGRIGEAEIEWIYSETRKIDEALISEVRRERLGMRDIGPEQLQEVIARVLSRREAAAHELVHAFYTKAAYVPVRPPAIAETLIPLFLPKKRADAMLGDLHEQFVRDVEQSGEQRARRLYRARVMRSIAPVLWMAIKRLGAVAAVADLVRRHLGG